MDAFRDPRADKTSASRSFLAVTLAFIFVFVALDALALPVGSCAQEVGCGTTWTFAMSAQAYALLGTITTMLSVWAGFGTSNKQ
jgi:hypothetical protein